MPDTLTIVDDDGAGFEVSAVDPIGGYRHIAEMTPTTEGPPAWLNALDLRSLRDWCDRRLAEDMPAGGQEQAPEAGRA